MLGHAMTPPLHPALKAARAKLRESKARLLANARAQARSHAKLARLLRLLRRLK